MTWVKMSVSHPRVTRFNPKAVGLGILAVLAVGAVIAVVIGSMGLPDRIETLTAENQTEFPLEVEVSGDEESWLGVGVVDAGATREFERVIDQGAVWVFRFSGQGQTSSSHRFSRQEMVAGDWTLVIPRSVGEELRASGVEPPP